ncbi:MAG: hypothetical protein NVSMB1_08870 [Polyangiales bacterium]
MEGSEAEGDILMMNAAAPTRVVDENLVGEPFEAWHHASMKGPPNSRGFRESWFDRRPPQSLPPSENPLPPVAIGHPVWSALVGLVTGGIGGVALVEAANYVNQQQHGSVDIVRAIGAQWMHASPSSPGTVTAGLVCAAVVGAVVGAAFGRLTRRLFSIVGRMIFAIIFAPAVWTLAHVFLLRRLAPSLAQLLPYLPMIAGTVAYAVCVAIVPPIRARRRFEDQV